ncbi:MAG: hypothetical protein AB1861_05005, partial [Cyanobacteriota bacterium]
IASNGQTFTRAIDPESPQVGEFLYNPYTNTVQVYSTGDLRSLQIYGSLQEIKFSPPLLPPPYPQLFTNLPLQGAIQFTRQFEQQPSAQFELESTLPKSTLQEIFAPGGELDLYGIPLRINSASFTELPRAIYPDARIRVSVSLGSRWENRLDQQCFLRGDGKNNVPGDTPFSDADCVTPQGVKSDSFNLTTTVQKLLTKVGIPYSGPTLKEVEIPRGTPRNAVVNPVQLLQERSLLANSFIRWSDADSVKCVPINSMRVWEYAESDILGEVATSYEAIAKASKKPCSIPNLNPALPDLINFPSAITPAPIPQLRKESPLALGFEYPNSELTGRFQETKREKAERTQGQSAPRYVRKTPTQNTRIDGDLNADTPLEGVFAIATMPLCFDIGGQTKTRSYTKEEDGATVSIIDEIWGFAYTAREIYNDATGKLVGNPNDYWQCLKRTRADYTYDPGTGYLLYITTTGYNTVRYRQETADSPETLELDPSEDEYSLYNFFRIPVIIRTSYNLRLMPEYSNEGLFELIKVCNRDGTSTLQPLINPDYAPPYYVEFERTESVAFAIHPNPDNEGIDINSGEKFAPDLIVGEESRFESFTQITEAIYQEKLIGFDNGIPVYERGDEITPQKFIKYVKQFKAQGQQIAEALEEISVEEGTGDPPLAQRRPAIYQIEELSGQRYPPFEQTYKYYLQTAGYTALDPISGSENFELATTLPEALTAAKCKLAIENWRNGFAETLQIAGNFEIKEGDRFNYYLNGEYRQRVVLGISTTLDIKGVIEGRPMITYTSDLTLGPWVTPGLNYTQVPEPRYSIIVTNVISETLGRAIDWSRVRSRRNPEAEEQ